MKTLTSILLFLLIAFSQNAKATPMYYSVETNCIEPASPCTITVTFHLSGKIGHGSPCVGLGLGCLKFNVDIDVTRSDLSLTNAPIGQCGLILEYSSPSSLTISYLADNVTSSDFIVDQNLVLPAYICKKLGVSSMTILKGTYKSSVNASGVWKTTFNVK